MKTSLTVSPLDFEHAVTKAAETGQTPQRDVALLLVAYGTGLMPIELAKITIADYLNEDGTVRERSKVRAEIAFNSDERPLFWGNHRIKMALNAYLAERLACGACLGVKDKYQGLAPASPIFLAADGKPFTFTKRVTKKGTVSYSCESLTQVYRRLHTQTGIAAGSALSARKAFMVRLAENGIDPRHIKTLLGVSSITSVRRVTDAVPIDLCSVVSTVV